MATNTARASGGFVAAINVTPMADVMIVLLIIFMVTIPMLDRDDGLRLPQAPNSRARREGQLVVLIRSDASILVGAERVFDAADLQQALRRRLDQAAQDRTVYLKADRCSCGLAA
jgi:biopolymer transport protein ExbD